MTTQNNVNEPTCQFYQGTGLQSKGIDHGGRNRDVTSGNVLGIPLKTSSV